MNRVKGLVALWIVLVLLQTGLEKLGLKEKIVNWDQVVTKALVQLDPFALAHHFDARWNDPHSLWAWSWSAPFNSRVHDDKILMQLREMQRQAPAPPKAPPIRFSSLHRLFGENAPATDDDSQQQAVAEFRQVCKMYMAQYVDWERPYHQLAKKLINFNENEYEKSMIVPCPPDDASQGDLVGFDLGAVGYYDQTYLTSYFHQWDSDSNWGSVTALWQDVLGLPDALLYTVKTAFAGGIFQSFLAVVLLLMAVGLVARAPILIPLLPFVAGGFGWVVLEMVRGAHFVLEPFVPGSGLSTVTSIAFIPLNRWIGALVDIVEHEFAHKVAHATLEAIEHRAPEV